MPGILDGVRVLDLTRNFAGPCCTQILGDLGADIVKVERPGPGDDTREWRPPDWNGVSTSFMAFNRNKRSLAVDLDAPDGQAIVRRLALRADVLVESFRHGSLAKRGLDYARVSAENPRVVYCSINGFGSTGPLRDRPGYDPVVQAYSGIMSITGEPGRRPLRTGPSIVDIGTGMWCGLAVVGALYARERTGRGARIESSLLETGVAWVGYHLIGYFATGRVPGPVGSSASMIAPYEGFATRDGHLQLAAGNNAIFARLCRVLDLPELPADPRFRTNADRVAHREELHEILEAKFVTRSAREWEETLSAHEVPCSRVRRLDEVTRDPQVAALDMFPSVPHAAIPDLRLVDQAFRIDGDRAARLEPPPSVGQHTDEILATCGYGAAEIADLRTRRVIG
jgi:crotonobetainyl-CoA:carnitine CoA-transferase CaiB-like acyl-CoA transferase